MIGNSRLRDILFFRLPDIIFIFSQMVMISRGKEIIDFILLQFRMVVISILINISSHPLTVILK